MFMLYFIHKVLTKTFHPLFRHLQGDVFITRMQRYKCGQLSHRHTITINIKISVKITHVI